eukprot:CAMPEP_0206036402 /NCGR_PEP_ID=MMETSP1466-20131121/2742_1 /ASSEMBLY_ACC=CAM_ASM_001126 /TAXON_ID=44452 /ORGANISM="Pavlova gyrans, Strain CCMP608" /LENGTH=119 /DNA_ID=CAMNT_0053410869 /DNA_START=30 /DNA_END=389 /DNA_ORIENTATION=-
MTPRIAAPHAPPHTDGRGVGRPGPNPAAVLAYKRGRGRRGTRWSTTERAQLPASQGRGRHSRRRTRASRRLRAALAAPPPASEAAWPAGFRPPLRSGTDEPRPPTEPRQGRGHRGLREF